MSVVGYFKINSPGEKNKQKTHPRARNQATNKNRPKYEIYKMQSRYKYVQENK